jgi:hypothetical protein
MSEYEKQVRDLAYRMWIAEGKPLGHAERHWSEAERVVAETAKDPGEQQKRANTDAAPVATDPKASRTQTGGTPRS